MKTFLPAILVLLFLSGCTDHAPPLRWRTRTVTRGTIVQEVRATGTVQPIKTVEVGTQVTGPILKLYVDYNASVTNGQLIAQIDPITYEASVQQSTAELASNQAQVQKTEVELDLAKKELARIQKLADKQMTTASDLDTALAERDKLTATLAINKAAVLKSEANLMLAKANLGYTTIRSPVDGVVIERNVDEGQTVVSSMNAQTLFNIATDLSRIQIAADIPEADVGGIAAGQQVTFTVDAYPQTFTGSVVQVRMASTSVNNVVTFPVIIEADNPKLRLFPGMTANLAIEIARANNVLKVPLAATRFNPPNCDRPREPHVWIMGESGMPLAIRFKRIIADGTQLGVEAEGLEDAELIVGTETAQTSEAKTQNPFAVRPPGAPPKR